MRYREASLGTVWSKVYNRLQFQSWRRYSIAMRKVRSVWQQKIGKMLESWRNSAKRRIERRQKGTLFRVIRGKKLVFIALVRYYMHKKKALKANRHYVLKSLLKRTFSKWKKVTKPATDSQDFIPIRITHATAISRKGDQLQRKQSLHITLLNPSFP